MFKKYKDDYEYKETAKEDGTVEKQFIYSGEYYQNNMTARQKNILNYSTFLCSAFSVCLFITAGFLNNDGAHCLYVVLPYICIFLPSVYFLSAVFTIWKAPEKLTREKYDNSYGRCRRMPVLNIVLSAICIICDVVFIMQNKKQIVIGKELLFLSLFLLVIIINFVFLRINNAAFKCIEIQK